MCRKAGVVVRLLNTNRKDVEMADEETISLVEITLEDIQAFALVEMAQDLNLEKARLVVERLIAVLPQSKEFRALTRRAIETIEIEIRYAEWIELVDKAVWRIAGLSANDLPDIDYYALFDGDASPDTAAASALAYAGFEQFK